MKQRRGQRSEAVETAPKHPLMKIATRLPMVLLGVTAARLWRMREKEASGKALDGRPA